jgi:hypothetical protein
MLVSPTIMPSTVGESVQKTADSGLYEQLFGL